MMVDNDVADGHDGLAARLRERDRRLRLMGGMEAPTEVDERMAGLFVYTEPLAGPEAGVGKCRWYLEGDRGAVAQMVGELVLGAEPVLVVTGRRADYGVVQERQAAASALAAADLERARGEVERLWQDEEVRAMVLSSAGDWLEGLQSFAMRLVAVSREAEFGRLWRRVLNAEAAAEENVATLRRSNDE
jgi:hypothetical protein